MTLLELLQLMRKHLKLVIILPILCTIAMAAVSYTLMNNTYTASTSMYVLAKQSSGGSDSSNGVNYQSLNASQMLANDVSTLLKSDRVASDTADDLHMSSLQGYKTSVTSETTSRVITLSVTGSSPETAAAIANKMTANVSKVAQQVMDVQSVNAIDEATSPSQPSGPNRPMYCAVAFLAGLFLAIAIVVVADMLNTKVRNGDEIEEMLGLPVIGRMPAIKGGK